MTTINIRGIPINFPFEPYDIQKIYMDKVIECLQNEHNGILESPTGTGKTLSLLCSSLAWLTMKKAQIQAQKKLINSEQEALNAMVGQSDKSFFGTPTIIYASRTHSQLTQAMQELKNCSYNYMKSTVVGSRDQMCIHPEVSKEQNQSVKINLCRVKVHEKSCHFYNRVESQKLHPALSEHPILDIEDLVKIGQKQGFCPYYMAKELKQQADIVFMPYNYLLDKRSRKALGIQLSNNIVILDEAHNIDRICEDGASIQIKTTDITLCITEVTDIMKCLSEDKIGFDENAPMDFSAEDLCILKEMLLKFENVFDEIKVKSSNELTYFDGSFMFELLGKANITSENCVEIMRLIDKILTFLATTQGNGPFQRKGNGLQLFQDLLRVVFADISENFKLKLNKCYKVNVSVEEAKRKSTNTWLSKSSNTACKVLSFWCFSPGFGMNLLKEQGIRCIILTSGTLAPLAPLITELELDIPVRLENPHIVKSDQIIVKVLPKGPDGEQLTSTFRNRDNISYINSLGSSILNLTRIIPNGLLIFFPSYPTLQKCQEQWQQTGVWSSISQHKAIFVEPKQKDAFQTTMNDYYARIADPQYKGAIFIGVCRGKISEGLDFADANGRAVILTGLPYPPLKDPRVILKKQYLNECNRSDKNFLVGDDWYNLEAARAVNQAMGRIIRHRHDYGAILLLDSRFSGFRIKSQLSLWLRDHIKVVDNFGEIIRDLRMFYKNADMKFSNITNIRKFDALPTVINNPQNMEVSVDSNSSNTSVSNSDDSSFSANTVSNNSYQPKRKKIAVIMQKPADTPTAPPTQTELKEMVLMMKNALSASDFQMFVQTIQAYRNSSDLNELITGLDKIFINKFSQRYLIQSLFPYIKDAHKNDFQLYWEKIK